MIQPIDDVDRPVVGKLYLVPAIHMARVHLGKPLWWPVTGPLDSDIGFFDFKPLHYHVDARFFNMQHARQWGTNRFTDDPFEAMLSCPVTALYQKEPKPPTPALKRMRCNRLGTGYPYANTKQINALNAAYAGKSAINKDGRTICPHRGARIDQYPADEHGIVTCPLHGLRIDKRTRLCVGPKAKGD